MAKRIIDTEFPDTSEEKEDVSFDIEPSLRTFAPDVEAHVKPQEFRVPMNEEVQLDYTNALTYCPRCGKPLTSAINIDGGMSPSWLECNECGTLINTFEATEYQAVYLKRPERYKMGAGGFGTGKSRTNLEAVMKHLCLIPQARVAVAAKTYPILDGTFKKEFYAMFPKRLVRSKNESKREMQLTNGSELLFRSFDDPIKFKSMNLTLALMVEGSDVLYKNFEMLQSRIRNMAACIPEYDEFGNVVTYYDKLSKKHRPVIKWDARQILIETNPDSGWVKKFLLDSHQVDFFGEAKDEGYRWNEDPDPEKYTQVVSTSANYHLPPNYEKEQTRGKAKSYILQYYKGSFNFSSNLVFPNFGSCIVKPHKLPREFDDYGERVLFYLIGMDYGINHPTHSIFAAFSSEERKLYVYGEDRINNSDVKTLAKRHRKNLKEFHVDLNGLMMLPKFDGRSYNRRESDLKTIGEAFEAEGLFFEPDFSYNETRIMKFNALINNDQVEVFSTCEFLIDEALNYKFATNKTTGEITNKPKDGNDHGITSTEFIVVALPANLQDLRMSAFLETGVEIRHDKKYIQRKNKKDPIYDPFQKEEKHGYNFNGIGINSPVTDHRHFGLRAPVAVLDDEEEESSDNSRSRPNSRSAGYYIPRY